MTLQTHSFGVTRSVRLDTEGDLTYVGRAEPGASEAAAVWQIQRMDSSVTDDLTILLADGNSQFDNVWADRAGLSYS